jgi:hypothetical protein
LIINEISYLLKVPINVIFLFSLFYFKEHLKRKHHTLIAISSTSNDPDTDLQNIDNLGNLSNVQLVQIYKIIL